MGEMLETPQTDKSTQTFLSFTRSLQNTEVLNLNFVYIFALSHLAVKSSKLGQHKGRMGVKGANSPTA